MDPDARAALDEDGFGGYTALKAAYLSTIFADRGATSTMHSAAGRIDNPASIVE